MRITVVGSINLDFVASAAVLPRAGETVTGATTPVVSLEPLESRNSPESAGSDGVSVMAHCSAQ